MPSIRKLLSKFSKKERQILELLIEKLLALNWSGLDIKKLRGYQNIFRLRKGEIRIIFTKDKRYISILAIDRRRENTYKF